MALKPYQVRLKELYDKRKSSGGDVSGAEIRKLTEQAKRETSGGSSSSSSKSSSSSSKSSSSSSKSSSSGEMSASDRRKLESAKAAYDRASRIYDDPETIKKAQDYAHQQAENIRAKYGYSGGVDGSARTPNVVKPETSGSKEKPTEQPAGQRYVIEVVDGRRAKIDTQTSKIVEWLDEQETTPTEPTVAPTQNEQQSDQIMNLVREFVNKQKEKRISDINRARQEALSTLEQQEADVAPAFQEARRGVRAEGRRAARTFDEFLAMRGLGQSGAAVAGQERAITETRRQEAQLREGEAKAMEDIAATRGEVQRGAISDIEQAGIVAEQQFLQSAISRMSELDQREFQKEMQERGYSFQEAMDMKNKDFQQYMADVQYQRQLVRDAMSFNQQQLMSELNSEEQINYLERQDELIRARQAGEIANDIALYKAKLSLDSQYGIGKDYSQPELNTIAQLSAAAESAYADMMNEGSYAAYKELKNYMDSEYGDELRANLPSRILKNMESFGESMQNRSSYGGREIY